MPKIYTIKYVKTFPRAKYYQLFLFECKLTIEYLCD